MRRAKRDQDLAAWRASLAGGLVVAGAVWGLLEGLRRAAIDVDDAVQDVWTAGKRLAQNTQAAHLLVGTRERGTELLGELELHLDGNGGQG